MISSVAGFITVTFFEVVSRTAARNASFNFLEKGFSSRSFILSGCHCTQSINPVSDLSSNSSPSIALLIFGQCTYLKISAQCAGIDRLVMSAVYDCRLALRQCCPASYLPMHAHDAHCHFHRSDSAALFIFIQGPG